MAYIRCGGNTGIKLEEDRDYEWDFTRSEHPELDINYGEPIWVRDNSKVSYSNSGLVIGTTGISVPLGNTEAIYWDKPATKIGKTIEIDIVEITGTNKPSIPTGSGRTYKRMFMGYQTNCTCGLNLNGTSRLWELDKSDINVYDASAGLLYTQKSTPEASGWAFYSGSWGNTLTPETVAYDSIGYFNGKTLKIEYTHIGNEYKCKWYVNETLLIEVPYNATHVASMYTYLPVFVIHDNDGMGGMTISGIRVYKNQWYEPKFQPSQP